MRPELYAPSIEGEARLLLLIDAFTASTANLDGRTKLAKLDFLLRYPNFFRRAIQIKAPTAELPPADPSDANIEQRMVRWRYGPWDPAHPALLGSLIGRGLIAPVSHNRGGVAYRTTDRGHALAEDLASTEPWHDIAERAKTLKRHFGPQTGNSLKKFIYEHSPKSLTPLGRSRYEATHRTRCARRNDSRG